MRTLATVAILGVIGFGVPMRASQALDVAGVWKLNKDLTGTPERGMDGRRPEGRRGGPGGGGRGGRGGGGMGRGGGGLFSGPQLNEGGMRKLEVVRRRMTEIADQLTIVHDGKAVSITDTDGRRMSLIADGKKQQQVTGDGEFKTKTHFEGWKLVVEEDFGGPKVITTYTPTLEGGEVRRLEVVVRAENDNGGGRMRPASAAPVTRVYDVLNP